MTVAKSIADGLPLAAVTGRREVMDTVPRGGLGTTYGGNPVACAAALKVIEILERDDDGHRARRLGARVMDQFQAWQTSYESIGDVGRATTAFRRSAIATPLAPSATKRCASARPIPDAPPVTTATRSASSTVRRSAPRSAVPGSAPGWGVLV